jgi:phosphate transport system substrate-binding protein
MRKQSILALALASVFVGPALAEVTLSTSDGAVSVSGELLGFEDNNYTIRTTLGDLVISGDLVECIGEDCPVDPALLNQQIRIVSSNAFSGNLVPNVISSYGASISATVGQGASETGAPATTLTAPDGLVVATVTIAEAQAASAFDQLLSGAADIIFTERAATNAEIERFLDAGLGDLSSSAREVILGEDGAVTVVFPSNPVTTLTLAQKEAIFSGTVTNWSQLGGPNLPVSVYIPEDGSGLSDLFTAAVLDANFSTFARSATRLASTADIDAAVAQDPGGIGLTSFASVRQSDPVDIALSCGIQASANSFTLRAEEYPMSRRLYAYTAARNTVPRAQEMVEILKTSAGASLVTASGFLSLETDSAGLATLGQQLAYAIGSPDQEVEIENLRAFSREVYSADRLSTTFRFSTGSSQIDNKGRADAIRLMELLQRPENFGSEVLLVGFTDSIGRSEVNTVLSQRRAEQVRDAIVAASGNGIAADRIRTLGYGAAFPASCNDDNSGRQINRRVEVWLR